MPLAAVCILQVEAVCLFPLLPPLSTVMIQQSSNLVTMHDCFPVSIRVRCDECDCEQLHQGRDMSHKHVRNEHPPKMLNSFPTSIPAWNSMGGGHIHSSIHPILQSWLADALSLACLTPNRLTAYLLMALWHGR